MLNVGNNRKDHRIRYLTGRTKLPGYAQPTVEYIDPYSGEPDSYMVNQEINRKKHSIGSEYKLLYLGKENGL